MSRVYIQKLKSIGDEFSAAKGALEYAALNWQKQALYNHPGLELIGPQDVRNAAALHLCQAHPLAGMCLTQMPKQLPRTANLY